MSAKSSQLRPGIFLVICGAFLVAVTYITTGAFPKGLSAYLVWVTLAGGCLRLLAIVARAWKAGSTAPGTSTSEPHIQLPEQDIDGVHLTSDLVTLIEPESDLEQPAIRSPLEHDLRLLGLGAESLPQDARRAYWTLRAEFNQVPGPENSAVLAEAHHAYRRLRKILPLREPLTIA